MEVFLVALVVVALSFIILGFNIFFRKKEFPETEVGKNREMRKLGIYCTKCEESRKWREMQKRAKGRINPLNLKIDTSALT